MHISQILKSCTAVATVLLLVGCSTIVNSHRQKQDMMTHFIQGRNKDVQEEIDYKLRPSTAFNSSVVGSVDEIPWRLEAGSMYFHIGNYAEAVKQLECAENLIADYDQRAKISVRDMGSEGLATVTNLNALPYRGLCRDRMALGVYKSLAYLGMGREDAFRAQIKRLREQQKKVQDDYKEFFEAQEKEAKAAKASNPQAASQCVSEQQLTGNASNAELTQAIAQATQIANKGYGNFLNPAAIFLSGLGSMRDGVYDNARIDFQRIYEAMPQNPLAKSYYATALQYANRPIPAELNNAKAFDFPLDRDCVYVLFTHGRSAAFKQVGIYFPISTAFPVCEFYQSPFTRLAVTADGKTYATLPLADMDGILAQEYKERLPGMITRIVISTLVKEGAFWGGLAAAHHTGNSEARLLIALFGFAYKAAVNTADTRSWEILPKEFQLTQFPMPQNRTLNLATQGYGSMPFTVTIPQNCRSAIVVIDAPSQQNIFSHVLPLKSK